MGGEGQRRGDSWVPYSIISEQGFLSFSNVTVASPQANAQGYEPEAQITQGEYSLDLLLKCGAWRRLLRVPGTAGRSNQSILKEINSDYSLEGLMLKLKLQYFGHLLHKEPTHWKRHWKDIGKVARKDWRQKEKRVAEDEIVRWHCQLNGHKSEQTSRDSEGQGSLVCCSS